MRSLLLASLAFAHPAATLVLTVATVAAWLLVRLARRRRSAQPNLYASAYLTATPPVLTRDQQAWLALGVPTQSLPPLRDRTPS